MPLTLLISTAHLDQIIEHTRTNPQIELCGLIGGSTSRAAQDVEDGERAWVARSIYPVSNIAADCRKQFLMNAGEQIRAQKFMRDRNEQLIGIYHSHPGSCSAPSDTDRRLAAYPNVCYLIVAPCEEDFELVAWYFDGQGFSRMMYEQI